MTEDNYNLPPIPYQDALQVTPVTENGYSYNDIDFFLLDEIESKYDYCKVLREINNARACDSINIHINCYGGDLDAGLQFAYALRRTQATVNIFVEGACMSAATLIMLQADTIEFSPWSSVMFHSYSGGSVGKFQELQAQNKFTEKWFKDAMTDICGEFLTENELVQMFDGKDLWFGAKDCEKRFERIFKERIKQMEKDQKKSEKLQAEINKVIEKFDK